MKVNGKWLLIWKEVILSCLKILQQNASEESEENTNLRRVGSSERLELGAFQAHEQQSCANQRALFVS